MAGGTLVTGAAGFVGAWLVPALRASGRRAIGVRLPGRPRGERDEVDTDLRDPSAVDALVAAQAPAAVVHLAGVAHPAEAARSPLEALRSNTLAVHHLLRAVAAHAPHARVLLVSSGAVYGTGPLGRRCDEDTALLPGDVYAASKAAAECIALELAASHGLDVVRARPFNHTGPGRPATYAESAFAQQLVRIEQGKQEPVLRVGNLDAVRDFSDVRDVVDAYLLLLERGESGSVYNVASGQGRSLRSVLDALLARSNASPHVLVDPERFRPTRPASQALVGNASRLAGLGWRPRHALDDTLGELLDDWRARP